GKEGVDRLRAGSEDRMGTLAPDFTSAFPVATSSHAAGRNLRATTQVSLLDPLILNYQFVRPPRLQPYSRGVAYFLSFLGFFFLLHRRNPQKSRFIRLITETARQSQDAWGGSGDWSEIELPHSLRTAFSLSVSPKAIPLFSPVIVPMAQSFGPLLSQLTSSPSLRRGVVPDIPPAMADAVNRGGEILSNLTAGTPWEAVAREVGSTLGTDSGIVRAQISKDIDALVDLMTSWMDSNSGPRLIRS
ncbi:hypothetical protein BHE74_00032019, partial [Ensete ventricosum]